MWNMPVQSASISPADPAHPAPSEAVTLEWSRVRGVSFPARIRNSNSGDGSSDIRTEKLC